MCKRGSRVAQTNCRCSSIVLKPGSTHPTAVVDEIFCRFNCAPTRTSNCRVLLPRQSPQRWPMWGRRKRACSRFGTGTPPCSQSTHRECFFMRAKLRESTKQTPRKARRHLSEAMEDVLTNDNFGVVELPAFGASLPDKNAFVAAGKPANIEEPGGPLVKLRTGQSRHVPKPLCVPGHAFRVESGNVIFR